MSNAPSSPQPITNPEVDIHAELQRLRDEAAALRAGFQDLVTDATRLCNNVLMFKQALADAQALSERARLGGLDAEMKEAARITEALWQAIEADAGEMKEWLGGLSPDLLVSVPSDAELAVADAPKDPAKTRRAALAA